jgi:hypothetical protein
VTAPATSSGGSTGMTTTRPTGASGARAAAGGGGSSGSPSASAAGAGGGRSAAGAASMPSTGETGSLPAIMDPGMMGPYEITETDNVGPMNNYTTIEPKELGKGEINNPILIWGPGAGSTPAIYQTLLNHIASHGFVVVSYNSTPQGPELNTAIDWIVSESKRQGSKYFDTVDTSKIAMGGQSAGSLAIFQAAKDERLTTTLHINGGSFNHDDVAKLLKPALFVCGDNPDDTGGDGTWVSDLARPNCDADFMNAEVPVWYGNVIGSSHTTVIDNPLGDQNTADDALKVQYLSVSVAWLRWQLAGDQVMKAMFVGQDCGYCKQSMIWKVQQRDLQ